LGWQTARSFPLKEGKHSRTGILARPKILCKPQIGQAGTPNIGVPLARLTYCMMALFQRELVSRMGECVVSTEQQKLFEIVMRNAKLYYSAYIGAGYEGIVSA
jgi:hypothetical protein